MTKSASLFPNRIAFKCLGEEITYQDLKIKSNQISNLLLKKGIKKGDRVGILMHRCIETSFTIYGILQSGAVYVPIDPKAPISRIKFQIDNCDIRLVLSVKQQRRISKVLDADIIEISQDQLDGHDSTESSIEIAETDNAYILYTSGSTGIPKGILHTHKSGFGFAELCAKTFGIKETDTIANHAPIFFDISTLAYFAGPFCGACTIIIPDAHTIMAASMVELISREKITIWYSVPLALVQMMDSGGFKKENLEALRIVFYAGEPFNTSELARLMQEFRDVRVINLYGPTETNVCTIHEIKEVPTLNTRIPIGKPWDKTYYKVIDSELLISSITTMKGYWGNEGLTKKSFARIEDKQYYKTGDLVEVIDEVIYLKGRRDHQIKIRGFRVELGDVENAFIKHPAVREAVALAILESGKVKDLYVALLMDESISESDLLNFVKDLLPKYAVPSKIIMLDEFPRTSTGKVQRSEIMKLVS
jgi:amino acid adenylation domain-containing protein